MEGIEFRLATVDDHNAVMDISPDVYGGMDYLMNEFELFMTDPRYTGFIGEKDGKAISFLMATTQLSGRKLVVKAGRVREEWRGRGVYGRLMNFMRGEMKQRYPSLQTEEFTTTNANVSLHKLLSNPQYKNFNARVFLNYRPKQLSLQARPTTDLTVLEDLDNEGLAQILQNEDQRKTIFPKRIFVEWEMYDPVLSEMTCVREMGPDIMATVGDTAMKEITALSTCCSYKTLKGRLYVIQFHLPLKTCASRAKEAVASLIFGYLSKLPELSPHDIISLSLDVEYSSAVTEAAGEWGLEKIDQFATTQYAFYRDIGTPKS